MVQSESDIRDDCYTEYDICTAIIFEKLHEVFINDTR